MNRPTVEELCQEWSTGDEATKELTRMKLGVGNVFHDGNTHWLIASPDPNPQLLPVSAIQLATSSGRAGNRQSHPRWCMGSPWSRYIMGAQDKDGLKGFETADSLARKWSGLVSLDSRAVRWVGHISKLRGLIAGRPSGPIDPDVADPELGWRWKIAAIRGGSVWRYGDLTVMLAQVEEYNYRWICLNSGLSVARHPSEEGAEPMKTRMHPLHKLAWENPWRTGATWADVFELEKAGFESGDLKLAAELAAGLVDPNGFLHSDSGWLRVMSDLHYIGDRIVNLLEQ